MTLENYISEAVSHGRKHSYIPMLDELDDQVTLDEFTGLLDSLGFEKLSDSDDFMKERGRKVYKISPVMRPTMRVLVKNRNDNNREYLRVRFDYQTKKFRYVQTVSLDSKIGTNKTDIENLIEYLK